MLNEYYDLALMSVFRCISSPHLLYLHLHKLQTLIRLTHVHCEINQNIASTTRKSHPRNSHLCVQYTVS